MSASLWWMLSLLLVVAELLSGTFFALMLALAAAITAGAAHLGLAGWSAQAGLFAALALLLCLAWRRRRPRLLQRAENDLNRGHARWVGRVIILPQGLSGGQGQVSVDDSFWVVRGPDCAPGSAVRIVAVEANSLLIEPVDPAA